MADDFALCWSLLLAGVAGAGPCSLCQSGTYFTGSGLLWGCIVMDEHDVKFYCKVEIDVVSMAFSSLVAKKHTGGITAMIHLLNLSE